MKPVTADFINAAFELTAAVALWFNVSSVVRAKCVKGIHGFPMVVCALWALWNPFYYHSLSQPLSRAAAISAAAATVVWSLLCLYYAIQRKRRGPVGRV